MRSIPIGNCSRMHFSLSCLIMDRLDIIFEVSSFVFSRARHLPLGPVGRYLNTGSSGH